jgi:hypothetical protein
MKVNLRNSIYQQKGSGYNGTNGSGLTVKDGMLINNRADGETGIAQMARVKKEIKTSQKIEMYSQAVAIGNMKSEIMESMSGMSCD